MKFPALVPLPLLITGLLLLGCSAPGSPPPPDYGPVGDGLKVIGYALVAMAVLFALSKFINRDS